MLANMSNYFSFVTPNQSAFFFQPAPLPTPTPIFENDLAFQVVSAVKNKDDDSLYKYGKQLSKLTNDNPTDPKEHYALALYYTHPHVNLSDERKYKKIIKHLEWAIKLDPDNKLYQQKLSQVETAYHRMKKELRR